MHATPRTVLKSYVTEHEAPSIADVIELDRPNFEATSYLVGLLTGEERIEVKPTADGVGFIGPNGTSLLQIILPNDHSRASISGDLALQIQAIIEAARVHEVESYDWVNLPPQMKARHLEVRASRIGLSTSEFLRFIRLWVE
jgi:hypothetical protein